MDFFKTAENIGISPNDLFLILSAIEKGDKTFSSLMSETHFSKETIRRFNSICESFLRSLLLRGGETSLMTYDLNESGKALLETAKKYKKTLTEEEKNKVKEFLEYCENTRPPIKRQYDHFICTVETKIKRVEKLLADNILFNQSILFVGDNDLTSIALALVNIPMRICVVDIDRELLAFINKISKEKKLNIEVFETDLTKESTTRHSRPVSQYGVNSGGNPVIGKFDVVFSDPPYTPNGFSTFLNAQLKALVIPAKAGIQLFESASLIYVCYGTSERSPEKFLPVQKAINDFNLEIREVLYKFNLYTGAESIGNASNLYVLKPTEKTKPLNNISKERFYTND